jgi:hypothetical protein
VSRAAPYSRAQVDSPTLAFDYVLYLGCLTFGIGLGYFAYRFHLLQDHWDAYLLAAALLYFLFAYRFDNRFVLSLALSTLAAWFGVRLSMWRVLPESIRGAAIAYGALVAAAGLWTHRRGTKAHFLDAYLHVGVNAVLLALESAAVERTAAWGWTVALLAVAAAVAIQAFRSRRFPFLVYGVAYAYVAISAQVAHIRLAGTTLLMYFLVSAMVVVIGLARAAARFGGDV